MSGILELWIEAYVGKNVKSILENTFAHIEKQIETNLP